MCKVNTAAAAAAAEADEAEADEAEANEAEAEAADDAEVTPDPAVSVCGGTCTEVFCVATEDSSAADMFGWGV